MTVSEAEKELVEYRKEFPQVTLTVSESSNAPDGVIIFASVKTKDGTKTSLRLPCFGRHINGGLHGACKLLQAKINNDS